MALQSPLFPQSPSPRQALVGPKGRKAAASFHRQQGPGRASGPPLPALRGLPGQPHTPHRAPWGPKVTPAPLPQCFSVPFPRMGLFTFIKHRLHAWPTLRTRRTRHAGPASRCSQPTDRGGKATRTAGNAAKRKQWAAARGAPGARGTGTAVAAKTPWRRRSLRWTSTELSQEAGALILPCPLSSASCCPAGPPPSSPNSQGHCLPPDLGHGMLLPRLKKPPGCWKTRPEP